MKKTQTIKKSELEAYIEENPSDDFVWYRTKIKINGVLCYREDIVTDKSTKSTAQSLIKKEAEYDYDYMDAVYAILEEKIDMPAEQFHIRYAHIRKHGTKPTHNLKNELDLYSAFPHIIKYEKMPIAGNLYHEENPNGLNFYRYNGEFLRDNCIITDDLAKYVTDHDLGTVEFLFATDCKIGSNMADKLIGMVYKNKKTKAEVKELHWGYYQKRYLSYIPEDDCFGKNPDYNHELFMVAIESQLRYIMLNISDIIGDDNCGFVKDAVHYDKDIDVDYVVEAVKKMFPNYDFRIIDKTSGDGSFEGGMIVYKSYPDLQDAPRSHHKKKEQTAEEFIAQTEAKKW